MCGGSLVTHGIFVIVVTLDMDIAILGVRNLSFGRPGASTLAPWGAFLQLGDTLEDNGSNRKDTWGVRNHIFHDSEMISEPF